MTQISSTSSTIATIDLARVAAKDPQEISKLLEAAQYPGFFYVDFRSSWDNVNAQAQEVYAVADEYFDQPREVKMRDFRENQPASSDRGFKSCETDESFEMSTDEMDQPSDRELPGPISQQTALVNDFHRQCQEAARLLLAQLAAGLGSDLLDKHRVGEPSESGLKLIAEPSVPRAADVIENKHRDSGSLTMLFYDKWSLQVCMSDEAENEKEKGWMFVPPPSAGCAIVHAANALARLSDGRVRSPLHRVAQPCDGADKRYFLSYFLRPESRVKEEWAAAA